VLAETRSQDLVMGEDMSFWVSGKRGAGKDTYGIRIEVKGASDLIQIGKHLVTEQLVMNLEQRLSPFMISS